jgi:hypothetical protein
LRVGVWVGIPSVVVRGCMEWAGGGAATEQEAGGAVLGLLRSERSVIVGIPSPHPRGERPRRRHKGFKDRV